MTIVGELSIFVLLALCVAIAWLAPVVDMHGEKSLDGRVFWIAVLIGLLVSVAFMVARVVWRWTKGL